jgi:FKBP-type peptidyl-prolyl cis-trans isomerase FkpA
MSAFQEQVMARQQEKQKALGEKNKKEGEAFLAANKAKPGVKTTASGLQYEVLKEGTGPKAKATDKVTVNYKGTLVDGKTFDSSYDRGQPVTFGVNQVIPGWVEGLQLMSVGSKYHFVIPSALAYGDAGAGADIGPSSVLQFDVEVMKIEPGDKPEAPPAAEPKMDAKPPGQ